MLDLRAGELVEVRSEAEILATLDETGACDALPFMPEMLAYCGRQVRVYKRADKTCDTIEKTGGRRMLNTVHLADLRCDGRSHGGCQAACLLFWKEAWLKRVPAPPGGPAANGRPATAGPAAATRGPACDHARLVGATRVDGPGATSEPHYRCQATELRRASSPLAWWDVRQYVRDVRSGNVGLLEVIRAFGFSLFKQLIEIRGQRLFVHLYDAVQRRRRGTPYPFKGGSLTRTPQATLDLVAGDYVQVKSHQEILQTVNTENRNRGLRFDAEMVPYCGQTYRVRSRVERLIDEKTGRMVQLPNDCIILDGVVCQSRFSAKRLFCPRAIFPYWREIWLKKVDDASPR
jgi:hypothetical protein